MYDVSFHNIVQINNSVMWDWQYSLEYSIIYVNVGIFHIGLYVPQKIVMDMNNVMFMLSMILQQNGKRSLSV